MEILKPKILVVGTGAVGGYYAGRLAQAGAHVSALCRSDYAIVKQQGINIRSISGDFHFIPQTVVSDITDYEFEPEYILIATKVLPEVNIPEIVKKKVFSHTAIVLLQNGIEIEEPIASSFPNNEVISAIAFIAASRPSYGVIEHQDFGRIILGKYPAGSSERIERLAQLFKMAGVPCDIEKNIIAARWKKLMWNASFNPISVLGGGINTREMTESETTIHLLKEVMYEIIAIAEKSGYVLPQALVEKNIRDTKTSAIFKTSMLQDFERKNPLEVEAILGNAIRIAVRNNVPVPHIKTLYALLKLIDTKLRTKTM